MIIEPASMTDERIRRRVRALIEHRGLTVKEVAAATGTPYRTLVGHLKEGGTRLTAETVGKLAVALRISVDWLVTGRGHLFDGEACGLAIAMCISWHRKIEEEKGVGVIGPEVFIAYYLSHYGSRDIPSDKAVRVPDETEPPCERWPFTRLDIP